MISKYLVTVEETQERVQRRIVISISMICIRPVVLEI